jgi:glutathione synthase/RimK-type ligase-like ATP-grasp enzyme
MIDTIAIHGDNGFARRWPRIAERLGFRVKHVNAFSNSIWDDLAGCSALLWNVNHENGSDLQFARAILLSAEQRGIHVFPDHRTVWHFDDKVAQKFLLEAIGAPLAATWVFFDRAEALGFLESAEYPLVFKLRNGAGSLNVQLIRSLSDGVRVVDVMFGRGLPRFPARASLMRAATRAKRSDRGAGTLLERGLRAASLLMRKVASTDRERGYALFQRYVSGNARDVRVTVIGDRAFTFFRGVRPNDFRASGSGLLQYPGAEAVPRDMVDIAFSIAQSLRTQSLALDFVVEPESNRPVLLEISYTFMASAVEQCPGYFGRRQTWVPGNFDPAELILKDVVSALAHR